jgi:uncharacterized repeat protein (TIGR03803 family)
VFEVNSLGQFSVLYSFCPLPNCIDGSAPLAPLVRDAAGNLYGTTSQGGTSNQGTVFRLDKTGHETVLHSFGFCSTLNCTDGLEPVAGLIMDAVGTLYGTTQYGGAYGQGTVFEVDKTGDETVLYSFCSASGCTDGAEPVAGLIQDTAGNLYGTTFRGGANDRGTVFKLTVGTFFYGFKLTY